MPALTLDQLHNLMEQVCKNKVGAFFEVGWLVENIRDAFQNVHTISYEPYQTPFPKINAALIIDPHSKVDITISSTGAIQLEQFEAIIALLEPTGKKARPYNSITLSFDPVEVKLSQDVTDPNKFRFYLVSQNPKFTTTVGTPDQTVLKANGLTLAAYLKSEAAIEASAAPIDILDGFITSLPMLAIIEAMQQFKIGVPFEIAFEQGYIVIHGPFDIGAPSSCGPGAGTQVTSTFSQTPKPAAQGSPNGFQTTFTHGASPISRTPETGFPRFGYYFPLTGTFKVLGDNVIGPGVVASDSGDAFLFHWAYQASARPKHIQMTIGVNPTTHLPQLLIDAPFDVGGVAAVSMKVGCVTVPVLSSNLLGAISPSVFTLTFNLANTAEGAALIVSAEYTCSVDVAFYQPPMVDVLLNVLMGSFGNRLVAGELRRLVNNLNFTLITLDQLNFGPSKWYWRLARSFRTNSVLLGLNRGSDKEPG